MHLLYESRSINNNELLNEQHQRYRKISKKYHAPGHRHRQ